MSDIDEAMRLAKEIVERGNDFPVLASDTPTIAHALLALHAENETDIKRHMATIHRRDRDIEVLTAERDGLRADYDRLQSEYGLAAAQLNSYRVPLQIDGRQLPMIDRVVWLYRNLRKLAEGGE